MLTGAFFGFSFDPATDATSTKGIPKMRSYTNPTTGLLVELTDNEFVALHDDTLMKWEQAKATLDAAKEAEMALRKLYVAIASNPDQKKGTENIALGNGYKAKVVKKINYGWIKGPDEKTDVDAIHEAQDRIEAMGNEGAFLADRLFKWSCELSVSEYNKLEPGNPTHSKIKAELDKVIVTTEGAPTLEIVAPKSK